MNQQKGFHRNRGGCHRFYDRDVWIQRNTPRFQLAPPTRNHGNMVAHPSAPALTHSSNPNNIQETETWRLAWTGRTKRTAGTLGRVQGQRSKVTMSQQQVETGQQRVDVGERSSPEGEGSKLGQEVLQRDGWTGGLERCCCCIWTTQSDPP